MGPVDNLGNESDLRSHIRRDIIHSISDETHDTTQTRKYVEEWVQEFGDEFKINVQFVIPINLPPNRKPGFCKATVEKILDRILPTAGGFTETTSTGGWIDENMVLYREKSLTVSADVNIGLWEEIPIFMRHVIDDIQRDLKQKCVYIKIDNVAFGDPIDLLKINWDNYPSKDEFGPVDPDCIEPMKKPIEKDIQPLNLVDLKINLQTVRQDQITTRSSSNISANDVTINYYNYGDNTNTNKAQQDIATFEHIAESPLVDDENVEKAIEVSRKLEQNGVSIDPKQELKVANKLVKNGRLDEAEGIYKRLERKFKLENDEIYLAKNWYWYGYLEMTRGNIRECYDKHVKAKIIFEKYDADELKDIVEHQIGNALYYLGKDSEALRCFTDTIEFRLTTGDSHHSIFSAQYMISIYSAINGDYDKSRKQLDGCFKAFSQGKDNEFSQKMQRLCLKNYAWLEYLLGNKKVAITKFKELLEIESTPRFISCIHAALGRIYLEINQPVEAEKHHRECVKSRLLSGSRIGEWYERNEYTNPNRVWNYPPTDVSKERYDLMCPI